METLASVWTCDLSDLRPDLSSAWESPCIFGGAPPAGRMWSEQFSPHLQRNRQLQDTLLQREEELARLQQENNKLRGFLNSSFVKSLEEKAKSLPADGRRKLKRNRMHIEPFQNHRTSRPVSRRICRNLAAEFCSKTTETPSTPEPNLDLWVLRTLGLKDRDTIDTTKGFSSSSSSPQYSRSIYGNGAKCSFDSSFSSSTPSSVQNYHQTDFMIRVAECQEPNCWTTCLGQSSDFSAARLSKQHEVPEAPITLDFYQCPPETEINTAKIFPGTDMDQVQTQPVHWSPNSQTLPLDKIQFSPPGRPPPVSSSSPIINQATSVSSLSARSCPSAALQSPSIRSDLAFSMSISPSSSVKTHSFPHGQAFVRRHPDGKCNFTWLPRQEP